MIVPVVTVPERELINQSCKAADDYANTLVKRWGEEAISLARLTGWDVNDIRGKMIEGGFSASALKGVKIEAPSPRKSWWERLWGNG
ncbi:MAG: hypothetical protein ABIH17_07530 [Pseudomonadota bacterium]